MPSMKQRLEAKNLQPEKYEKTKPHDQDALIISKCIREFAEVASEHSETDGAAYSIGFIRKDILLIAIGGDLRTVILTENGTEQAIRHESNVRTKYLNEYKTIFSILRQTFFDYRMDILNIIVKKDSLRFLISL